MIETKKDLEQMSFLERLEARLGSFLAKHLKVVLAVVLAIGLIVIGIAIGSAVGNKRNAKEFDQIDLLQQQYGELLVIDSDDPSYSASYEALVEQLTTLSTKGKRYPQQKARYLLGVLAFEADAYQEAIDHFVAVHKQGKDTYLGSLSLANAAASAENLGDEFLALEYWTQIIDEYGFTAAESPKALFGQARLHEAAGNTELAEAIFQQLADQFPASEFAKLAQNKLALL